MASSVNIPFVTQGAFFLVAFGSLGTTMIGWGIWRMIKGHQSRGWPTVPGTIINSSVILSDNGMNNSGSRYVPVVNYEYTIESERFRSSRISFGDAASSILPSIIASYRVAKRFPVGSSVPVYYDPEQPADAVLLPGVDWQYVALILGGAFFLFGGILAGLGGSIRF